MLSNARDSTPIIFLVTDGAVEDERQICEVVNNHLAERGPKCPRIYTFGIGNDQETLSCNRLIGSQKSKLRYLLSDDF